MERTGARGKRGKRARAPCPVRGARDAIGGAIKSIVAGGCAESVKRMALRDNLVPSPTLFMIS